MTVEIEAGRVETALKVARLLNEGWSPSSALYQAGVQREEVFTESEFLEPNDELNDVIDFGWIEEVLLVVKRDGSEGKWRVEMTTRLD
jgi:hypothetical protein